MSVVRVATSPDGPGRPVVVAIAPVGFGQPFSEAAVQVRQLPANTLPSAALQDLSAVLGRIATVDVFPGEVLTPARLVTTATASSRGLVTTAVRISDPAVTAMVRPGDLVDVTAASDGAARLVADRVRVITVPREASRSSGIGSLGQSRAVESSVVLLAVTRQQAIALAGASSERLGLIVRPAER